MSRMSLTPTTPSPSRSAEQETRHPNSPRATSTSLTSIMPLLLKSPLQATSQLLDLKGLEALFAERHAVVHMAVSSTSLPLRQVAPSLT